MLLHLIADYGHGDLAFAEVQQRLAALLEATVVVTPVAPFDTLAAGFCIAQLALTEGPAERVVFHNVAPRQDAFHPRTENEGERLVALELESGVLVVGPNAGNALSFVSGHAAWTRYVEAPASGSQFRSRDFFPAAVARLASGRRDL
ncbi:MAG: SAM-dependent chlorinase/fluorinase, partial [Actinobacteria bacterium]|nr:SAM-dependent chlorinase/fluorinase [Actinomycetota bacterium]